MKFIDKGKKGGLGEVSQSSKVKFSLGILENGKVIKLLPWVFCRDFLSDQILCNKTGRQTSIYGFNTIKWPKARPVFILNERFSEEKLHVLNLIEREFAFSPSSKIEIENNPEITALWYDTTFEDSLQLFSFYTLLVKFIHISKDLRGIASLKRLLDYVAITTNSPEDTYARHCACNFDKLRDILLLKHINYPDETVSHHKVHHLSGMVSTLTGINFG